MKTRPRYPILTQCTIVPKLRRKGPCRGFYQRTVVTSGGVGSCTYLPAILWATRDYRARTHQDDYRGGEQINEGQPFFVLNLDGGGDEGSVPYPALDKALIEAARGRMPLIYGPPATFVLPQGLPTPEQLGKNKIPEAQVDAVDTAWRKAVQNGTPTDKLAAFQALAELV